MTRRRPPAPSTALVARRDAAVPGRSRRRRARRARRAAIAVLASLLVAGGAGAWTPDLPDWAPQLTFHGFGTLGVVHSSQDEADFVGNVFQPNGAGHYRDWDFGVDSKLGAQVDARFNDKLSAVVQIVARHRYDNQYWPVLEWANLKYEFTPDFSVRVGRTVAAPFMVSDTRLVGFSYPWVRPPLELYGVAPVTNRDGINAAYRLHLGSWTHSLEAAYGLTSLKLPGGGEVRAKNFLEVNDTISHGSFTFRFGYTFGDLSVHNPGYDAVFDGLREFGDTVETIPGFESTAQQAFSLANHYEVDDIPTSLFALGVSYDPGTWLVMAEVAREESSGALADATAWYITGGYRIGNFMPYVTFAQLIGDEPSESGIATAGLPPPLAQPAIALNGGLAQLLNIAAPSQDTVSVGVRWDIRKNVDLKLQYDHISLGSGSGGRLVNFQPDFKPGSSLDVFSFTLDFVF